MTKIISAVVHYKKNKSTTLTLVTDEIFSSGQTISIFDDNDILCFRGMVYTKEYAGDIITYEILGFDKELNEKVSDTYDAAETSQAVFQDIIDTHCTYLYRSSSIDPDGSFTNTWSNLTFYNKTIREIFNLIANSEDAYWWIEPDGKVWCKAIADLTRNDIYYHATQNNKKETIGSAPSWVTSETGNVTVEEDALGIKGHKKVIKIDDDDNTAHLFREDLTTDQTYGSWEGFIKSSDVTKEVTITLYDSDDAIIAAVKMDADNWYTYSGSAWTDQTELGTPVDDVWYHIQIDFDTTAGAHEGLAENTYQVYINNEAYTETDLDAAAALETSDTNFSYFIISTQAADQDYVIYFDAYGCPEDDNNYSLNDNKKGECYEGGEIASVPQITEILHEINYIKLYGSIVSGTRITATAEDAASQQLHGINRYFDHYPHESDATELGVIATAILNRTGFTDYPKFVSIAISSLDKIEWGETIRFHFNPYTSFQTAAEYYIIEDNYDVKKNIHRFKLSNGLVTQEETLGMSEGTKVITADEEQIDIIGGSALTSSNISDTAYNTTTWNDVDDIAPSKNAVRDKIETLSHIATGTYTGDGTDNREITGLGFQPTAGMIYYKATTTTGSMLWKVASQPEWDALDLIVADTLTNCVKFIADGFELNNGRVDDWGNIDTKTYYWVMWG